jgi:xylulokinase
MVTPRAADTPLVLAIDASTTGCKAIAFDASGAAVAIGRTGIGKSSPRAGWQEQDARDWWTALCSSIQAVTAAVPASSIRAACIAHQRESFVCLDDRWAPIRPAILWLDTRASAEIRELGTPEVHHRSGKPPSTTPSFYKLAWLARHEPDVLAATATVADTHAYLVGLLTGERVTSWASADPMGVVDQERFAYAPELVAACGLRLDQLPALAAPGSVIGTVSRQAGAATGLRPGTPVVAGGGDGQMAGMGAAVHRPDLAYLNLGTGVTLGTWSERYVASLAFRTLSSPFPGRWTLEALLASGVLSVAWFRDEVARDEEPDAEQRLESLAVDVPPGSDGLMFLPYLTSAETPYWDAAARGAWIGLREHHGRGHLYRAILEGIGFEQRFVLSRIEAETGCRVASLRAMGGGTRSRLWLQLLADILDRPIATSELPETTALGAGILAAAAAGLDGEHDLVATAERMTGTWREIDPSPPTAARYARLAPIYERIYPALAPLFADIEGARS